MSTTMSTTLGTSNLRTTSRQTRTNPTRTSKTIGSTLRQNSLTSSLPGPAQGLPEPHGFYPAIQHFADAITALPHDYRRHTSLLKEVDAKAWQPEEALQTLLTQCVANQPVLPTISSAAVPTASVTGETSIHSTANSVVGAPIEAASQYSAQSTASTVVQRRHQFAALRHNLMQIMVTMDEKNHVINNANDELSRHIRRLDNVWPHIADEISEEARLGSLKHWAYTETNPTKKAAAASSSRREAAATWHCCTITTLHRGVRAGGKQSLLSQSQDLPTWTRHLTKSDLPRRKRLLRRSGELLKVRVTLLDLASLP